MYRNFTGFCPVQNREVEISVDYINTSDLSGQSFVRGLMECDYVKRHGNCPAGNCPIFADAPTNL